MIKFKLIADAEFYAEDIDDAFLILARYWLNTALGEDDQIITPGSISIHPVEETDD